MRMFSKKQLLLNVILVLASVIITTGVVVAVRADEPDTNCAVLNPYYPDADGDGFGSSTAIAVMACSAPGDLVDNNDDCDDSVQAINPDAAEVCDLIDNNCDGQVNENLATSTYYRDFDNDGYGDASTTNVWCSLPQGYVVNSADCDDQNALVNPAAFDGCGGIDNNCDGVVDDQCSTSTKTFYRDSDNDGYGDLNHATSSEGQPAGYVYNSQDCDDNNSAVHPGATEICNSIDDDCDASTDEGLKSWYYFDGDSDLYGNPAVAVSACTQPSNYVVNDDDCDDSRAAIHPGAAEGCGGIDNNCDGVTDEGCATSTWYRDSDGDGYGNPAVTKIAESRPEGYADNSQDCNDSNASIHPGAAEICNNIDDDCDESVDEGLKSWYYFDADNDTYGDPKKATSTCSLPVDYVSNNDDCKDNNASVHPGAAEVCNNIDDDCDGVTDEGCAANDNDNEDGNGCDCECQCQCSCNCGCNNSICPLSALQNINHGQFVSSMAHLLNQMKKEGEIAGKIKGQLTSQAAKLKDTIKSKVQDRIENRMDDRFKSREN